MRILITGATGTVGRAIATSFKSEGHEIVCAARSETYLPIGVEHLPVDFADVPGRSWWRTQLEDVDVVVNCVGIFTESGTQSFHALHTSAPIELFAAAADAGVGLVIQLSALGSDKDAASEFHKSKYAADEALRKLPVRSAIVQPSLVYTPGGPSATLFNQIALLPVVLLPATQALLQPVHLSDVVSLIMNLADSPPPKTVTIPAVGPKALTIRVYLSLLRKGLGSRTSQVVLPVPSRAFKALTHLAAVIRPKFLHPSAVEMLERGNHADPTAFEAILGHAPRPVEGFLHPAERHLVRVQALLGIHLSLMKLALGLVWAITGILSFGIYPIEQSLALLNEFGLRGVVAKAALYSGALLDLLLGIALLLTPLPSSRLILAAQLVVMATYTVLISVQLPQWWLHPFGPVLKNLPIFVATGLLIALARRP